MSSDIRWILDLVPLTTSTKKQPCVLDLGGGTGLLRQAFEQRGYRYINIDIKRRSDGEPSVVGNAQQLPFKEGAFDLVVSKDTLEHFPEPWMAIEETHRVLKDGGHFIIQVPFMHPFHADDFYRYSPLGLRHMLKNFQIEHFTSPQWVFTVVGLAAAQVLKSMKLAFLQGPLMSICTYVDGLFTRHDTGPRSFAAAYRIIAKKSKVAICEHNSN